VIEFFSALADFLRPLWGLWLMLFFGGIIAWVMWPGKKRQQDFEAHAQIPLRDQD
jgi:cytochrome c oxidase cbb3-type subunit 4